MGALSTPVLPQFNFHRRTGLTPGYGVVLEDFGAGAVLVLRMGWAALTLTFQWPQATAED